MSRPISDVEVGADVEIEGDVIVVVLMVCSICAETCGRSWSSYFHYRVWTPQWSTFFAFARIHISDIKLIPKEQVHLRARRLVNLSTLHIRNYGQRMITSFKETSQCLAERT